MITKFWSSFASSSHNHYYIIDRQRITTNVKMGYYISRVAQSSILGSLSPLDSVTLWDLVTLARILLGKYLNHAYF